MHKLQFSARPLKGRTRTLVRTQLTRHYICAYGGSMSLHEPLYEGGLVRESDVNIQHQPVFNDAEDDVVDHGIYTPPPRCLKNPRCHAMCEASKCCRFCGSIGVGGEDSANPSLLTKLFHYCHALSFHPPSSLAPRHSHAAYSLTPPRFGTSHRRVTTV